MLVWRRRESKNGLRRVRERAFPSIIDCCHHLVLIQYQRAKFVYDLDCRLSRQLANKLGPPEAPIETLDLIGKNDTGKL